MVQVYKINQGAIKMALLILFAAATFSCTSNPVQTVFLINGEPIGLAEYQQQLERDKLMVINEFQSRYHIAYNSKFWSTNFEGQRPDEILKLRSKKAVMETFIKKSVAREFGIIRKISYDDFLKELEQVNLERKKAVKTGKIIYGPVTYQLEMYSGYYLSRIENAIKDKISSQGVVTDSVPMIYAALIQKRLRNAEIKTYENIYQQIKIH